MSELTETRAIDALSEQADGYVSGFNKEIMSLNGLVDTLCLMSGYCVRAEDLICDCKEILEDTKPSGKKLQIKTHRMLDEIDYFINVKVDSIEEKIRKIVKDD